LENGFVLKIEDQYFHGPAAIHRLALITTRVGLFNRLNYLIFKSAYLSKIVYPFLQVGRSILLRLLGIEKFDTENLSTHLDPH
jgi:hypothetical protein